MNSKIFNKKKIILVLILSLVVLVFLSYKNKGYIIKKSYQIAPNLTHKVRFYYFNLPYNIPNIPSSNPVKSDLKIIKNLNQLEYRKSFSKNIKIFNDEKKINYYMPKENYLLSGISNKYAGSSYIDFYDDELFILSSRGLIAFGKILESSISFIQIKNNLNDFLGEEKFEADSTYSFKDLLISGNRIYVSFTDEIDDKCWATSVLYSEINYEYLNFNYQFKPKECVKEDNGEAFVPIQSGGRIASLDKNNLLFTTGDYRLRKKAQDSSSIFGKILRINIESGEYRVVSIGLRNPQGLYVDQANKVILSTDHGPRGGDEINLMHIDDINTKKIPNFGWPNSSYGEHYAKKFANTVEKKRKVDLLYKKYPLNKSHKDYGFDEPIHYFTPSIGISEITALDNSIYMATSLGGKKLFFFNLDSNNKIDKFDIQNIGQRVRDVVFRNNKLVFFLEDTATIALVKF